MKKIGITSRIIKNESGNISDSIEHAYFEYFSSLGFQPLFIPNNQVLLREYLENFDVAGIVFSGGGDISASYQGCASLECDNSQKARDEIEDLLLRWAITLNKPVFGICRGMQFINVFFGGKITQNIENKLGHKHVGVNHHIQIVDEKFYFHDNLEVNSYHNHGVSIDNLASQLIPFAIVDDTLVEGFYHKDLPVVAVQWHPERQMPSKISAQIIMSILGNLDA